MSLSDVETRNLRSAADRYSAGPVHRLIADIGGQVRSRALEQWCRRLGRTSRRTATTFWGERMTVVYPDMVGIAIDRYGVFEPDLSRSIVDRVGPGTTFFDVGAHVGYFTLLAGHLVGPQGSVCSFEPTPSTFAVLAGNAAAHANITCVNAAALDEPGRVELQDFGTLYSAFNSVAQAKLAGERQRAEAARSASTVEVEAVTIDDWVRRSGKVPDFIKIDTEGVEARVLRGMSGLLSGEFGPRPVLSLEVGDAGLGHLRTSPSRDVVDFMLGADYRALEFTSGRWQEHTPREHYDYDNLLFEPAG